MRPMGKAQGARVPRGSGYTSAWAVVSVQDKEEPGEAMP